MEGISQLKVQVAKIETKTEGKNEVAKEVAEAIRDVISETQRLARPKD